MPVNTPAKRDKRKKPMSLDDMKALREKLSKLSNEWSSFVEELENAGFKGAIEFDGSKGVLPAVAIVRTALGRLRTKYDNGEY